MPINPGGPGEHWNLPYPRRTPDPWPYQAASSFVDRELLRTYRAYHQLVRDLGQVDWDHPLKSRRTSLGASSPESPRADVTVALINAERVITNG